MSCYFATVSFKNKILLAHKNLSLFEQGTMFTITGFIMVGHERKGNFAGFSGEIRRKIS